MKAQIHIRATGNELIVIDVVDDESISVDLDTHPNHFMPEPAPPTFAITGLRWRGGKHYHLGWLTRPLGLGESIQIEYSIADAVPTGLVQENEYIVPELTCNFCGKRASEVEYLVEHSLLARICSACVEICQIEIDKRRDERSPVGC